MKNNQVEAFFALMRAGLWERDVNLLPFGKVDYEDVMRLAEEQAVTGLVTAGLEHVKDVPINKEILLQFIGATLQIEERNKGMNRFIGELVERMRCEGIETSLVKGQAVAQCYERPFWRSSGDVDFYMSDEAFQKAKDFYRPLVPSFYPDNEYAQHINMTYGEWVVEIHANQRIGLSNRIDRVLDEIHHEIFYKDKVRNCTIAEVQISLPSIENDVLIVFTHFLKHFYKGGIGVRQICDWCRMLWTFKESLDLGILETRIRKMGLMTEWKAFAAYAVEYLGIPKEAMPMHEVSERWKKKADMLQDYIIEVGNFGHNRDSSYFSRPYLIRKCCSMKRRVDDLVHHARLFPMDSFRFFPKIMFNGVRSVMRGE